MNRRRFLIGAAAVAISPHSSFDGRSVTFQGREYALSDIMLPATTLSGKHEAFSDFAEAALGEIVRRGAPIPKGDEKTDRWGRIAGAIGWRTEDGRETTLQEMMLTQGAARVAPETEDFSFIERYFAAEAAARAARLGLWSSRDWRIRDASAAEWSSGYQIYSGTIRAANERKSRIFFNFGDDFRTDFTATVARGAFRRWKSKPDLSALAGVRAEARGPVERINGPSIEIVHEMQLRFV